MTDIAVVSMTRFDPIDDVTDVSDLVTFPVGSWLGIS